MERAPFALFMVDEIPKRLLAVPFRPFAILTSDGSRYPVPHPDHVSVGPRGTLVVVWDDNDTTSTLSPLHIVSVKTLRRAKSRRG